jgi:hypothetical protein
MGFLATAIVNIKRKIQIPHAPNFIITGDGGNFHVRCFTNSELKQIGALWTKQLIENARGKRRQRSKKQKA